MNKNLQLIYFFSKVNQYLFEASFASFVFFFFLEYFKEGIVTNYFNFNLLLIFTLIFGMVTILLPHFEIERQHRKSRFLAVILGILSGVLIYQILPDSLAIYNLVPWVVGITVWSGLKLLGRQ